MSLPLEQPRIFKYKIPRSAHKTTTSPSAVPPEQTKPHRVYVRKTIIRIYTKTPRRDNTHVTAKCHDLLPPRGKKKKTPLARNQRRAHPHRVSIRYAHTSSSLAAACRAKASIAPGQQRTSLPADSPSSRDIIYSANAIASIAIRARARIRLTSLCTIPFPAILRSRLPLPIPKRNRARARVYLEWPMRRAGPPFVLISADRKGEGDSEAGWLANSID